MHGTNMKIANDKCSIQTAVAVVHSQGILSIFPWQGKEKSRQNTGLVSTESRFRDKYTRK